MKMRVLTLCIIITSLAAEIKAQELKWAKILGSRGEEYALNHLTWKSKIIYIAGKTTGSIPGPNLGLNDGFLMRLDYSGNIIWKRQFGSDSEDDLQWSAIDKDGNAYLTGFTLGSIEGKNSGKEDIFLVKYNPSGELLWKRQVGTDSTDIAKGICIGNDGMVYITGFTYGVLGERSNGKADCFVMKFNPDGIKLTTIQLGTHQDDNGYCIIPGKGSHLLICGTTWGDLKGKNLGLIDGFTANLTADFMDLSFTQFGTEGFDIALVMHRDHEDNVYVGGSTSGNFACNQIGDGDCFLLKQDQNGNILWKDQFGTDHHDGIRGIDEEKGIIVSGILNLPPEKAFVRIYGSDGVPTWERTFETNDPSKGTSGKDIIADKKGFTHLGLTGSDIFGPLIGGHDIYLLKYGWK